MILSITAALAQSAGAFNVRDYGAIGNGTANDTASLNRAVDACSRAGGGTVRVPAGTYLTGTVHLKSNVTLDLDAGSTLRGISQLDLYQTTVSGDDWFSSVIQAKGAENIAVVGHGTIDGAKVYNPNGEERMRGPHALLFEDSRNITIRDVTFRDAANFAVVLQSSENANIDGISVFGGWDGIHLRDARDITIVNSRFYTGDDCLSGFLWKNVVVSNCILNTSCSGFRVGGQNVRISNLLIYGPGKFEHRTSHRHNLEAGFRLWPHWDRPDQKGPFIFRRRLNELGPIDNITLSDITIVNARTPLWIDPGAGGEGVGRITIRNLTATGTGRTPVYVAGRAGKPVQSVVIDGADIGYAGGGDEQQLNGQGLSLYSIFPSQAFYLSHVGEVWLRNLRIRSDQRDGRPALIAEHLGNLSLAAVELPDTGTSTPNLVLTGSDVSIDGQRQRTTRSCPAKIDMESGLKLFAGELLTVYVDVRNCGDGTLAAVPLEFGSSKFSKSVVLQPGETARVRFGDLKADAGSMTIRSGDLEKLISVSPAAPAGTPAAPWRTFSNTQATIQQSEAGFHLRAQNDGRLDRWDEYAALYQSSALKESGVIEVQLDNPDRRGSWGGRAGIMVRNAIAEPGRSGGYLIFAASPANGYALQWDSDGDGRLDQSTELGGYTYWPAWLRLERHGARYTGFYSKDRVKWEQVGSVQISGVGDVQDAGIFVSGSSARFADFKIGSQQGMKRQ